MYDIEAIKANNPIEAVIGQSIQLSKNGAEFTACCPFHSERTPSFSVVPAKDFAYCFGCGEHISDSIDWVMKYHGVNFTTACEILGGEKQAPGPQDRKRRITKIEKDAYHGIAPVVPVPDNAELISTGKKTPQIFNPKRADDPKKRFTTYTPSMVFEYRNEDGALIGYVLRVDIEGGGKITPTIQWCRLEDGSEAWCHYALHVPRSLYNVDGLRRRPDSPVMIVEGEKAADAAHRMLSQYVVVTWPGGTNGVDKADWSPLFGRKVCIWGDADDPGEKAAIMVAAKCLDAGASEVKLIQWDKEKPKGWDAADAEAEGITKDSIIAWAKERVTPWPPEAKKQEPEHRGDEPPIDAYEGAIPQEDEPGGSQVDPGGEDRKDAPKKDTGFFRALGYDKNVFYYLPNTTQQVIELSPAQHTENNLLVLAPSYYWEEKFPAKGDFKFNQKHAYEALINACIRRGIFDGHELLRGRGAWLDEGRVILHMGDKLIVDGEEVMGMNSVESQYIYEASRRLNIPVDTQATNKEANRLVDICQKLSWENDLSAPLLAGWCVIAPVCGILKWRPHIWVTGPSGSGKTTVIKDIVERVVGPIILVVEGNTSEAGIRQQIQQDARPIVFDECEAEDKNAAARMKSILDLARVASSGGRILKGDTTGAGTSYSIRSAFCFSSINTSLSHYADESRVSRLVLKQDRSEGHQEKYKALHHEILDTLTKDFSSKMLARTLANIHTLQRNAETFVEAAARVLRSRRIADQIGAMLAGTYLCHSTKEISLNDAVQWIEQHDWADHTTVADKSDEERLLDRIATHRTRVNVNGIGHDATLGELIVCVAKHGSVGNICRDEAEEELKRFGIMATGEWCYIANQSDPMRRVLRNTPWASEWGRPLRGVKGAESVKPIYFSPGIKCRATKLPISLFEE